LAVRHGTLAAPLDLPLRYTMTLSAPLFCTVPADVWATYKVSLGVELVAYAVLLRATEQQMEGAAIETGFGFWRPAQIHSVRPPAYFAVHHSCGGGWKLRH
jgi:hypothetical protein